MYVLKFSLLTINPSRVGIFNIFSGPIKIENKVPGIFPYYKISGEAEIHEVLEDYASPEENWYSENLSTVLLTIFPAEKWEGTLPELKLEEIPDNNFEKVSIDGEC